MKLAEVLEALETVMTDDQLREALPALTELRRRAGAESALSASLSNALAITANKSKALRYASAFGYLRHSVELYLKGELWAPRVARQALPFGLNHPEELMQPFCACGRVSSQCDGSRRGCRKASVSR